MKKIFSLIMALAITWQAPAQKVKINYTKLADFSDGNGNTVILIKSEGIYTISYPNYIYPNAGIYGAISSRDKKMLKGIFAQARRSYYESEDHVYKFQISPRRALIVKKEKGDVFILSVSQNMAFLVTEETATKLLAALD